MLNPSKMLPALIASSYSHFVWQPLCQFLFSKYIEGSLGYILFVQCGQIFIGSVGIGEALRLRLGDLGLPRGAFGRIKSAEAS